MPGVYLTPKLAGSQFRYIGNSSRRAGAARRGFRGCDGGRASMRLTIRVAMAFVMAVALCTDAGAQALGTIAGSAKDTQGAALPGVTVEVSSPALIEKVRSATTDTTGLYRIVNLPPGTYTVSFTLTGFNGY